MAPPPFPKKTDDEKGTPGQEEDAESPAAESGDVVEIETSGKLVGTVVGADETTVTVEVVVESSMVTVTEPEDAVAAGGLSEDQLRLLRSVRAGQVLATMRR